MVAQPIHGIIGARHHAPALATAAQHIVTAWFGCAETSSNTSSQ